jgi:WD40 repeat protein
MKFVALVSLLVTVSAWAEAPDFYKDVYPFLKESCISCHNKTTTKAGLNMETPELMKKGGDSGPAVVPGKSEESLVVAASVHTKDLEMPPKGNKSGAANLTPEEIAVLKAWIDAGAQASVAQERTVVWQPLAAGVHPIYSVALTKDGRFAACGRSNRVQLYDLATRQFTAGLADPKVQPAGSTHRAMVQALAFSPDGTRLASGSFREVKIWKASRVESTARDTDPALGLVITALSADGKSLAWADKTGALVQIDPRSGKVLKKIPGAAGGAKRLSLSPDGTRVALADAAGNLSVWEVKSGHKLASSVPPAPAPVAPAPAPAVGTPAATTPAPAPAKPLSVPVPVRALTFTRDGSAVVTAGEDKILRIWPLANFAAPKVLPATVAPFLAVSCGAGTDDLITLSEDGKVRFWSVAAGKVARDFTVAGAATAALSTDGKWLVTGSNDGAVRIWEVATGKMANELRGTVADAQKLAALNWTVAAQTLELAFQKSEVARIDAQTKALDELLKKAQETIVAQQKLLPEKEKLIAPAVAAAATGQKAVEAAGTDEPKRKAALEALQKLATAQTSAQAAFAAVQSNIKDAEAEVQRITESKASNAVALTAANNAIAVATKTQSEANAAVAALQQSIKKGNAKPIAVAFSGGGERVAGLFADGTLQVWASASGMAVAQVMGKPVSEGSLGAAPSGGFVGCGRDGAVWLSGSGSTWSLERILTGFADQVNALRFSPDGKLLATGGGEPSRSGDVILFDVGTGKAVQTWKERHSDAVLSLDFSPDGKRLASGAADKIAKVTDVATGKQVNLFEGHTHYVMGVAFRADGRVLATAGADGTVVTWDMILGERKKKIEGWRKEVTSLQFIGATNQIVTSAGDNLVRIVSDDGAQIRSIANLPDFMQSAVSSPSATIVAGGEDSVLRGWNGADGKEIAVFGIN